MKFCNWTILILYLSLIRLTNGFIGGPCKTSSDCRSSRYDYTGYSCNGEICRCGSLMPTLIYDENLATKCTFRIFHMPSALKCKPEDDLLPCVENGHCWGGLCACKDEYLHMTPFACVEKRRQKLGDECKIENGTAYYCDYTDRLQCSNNVCKCLKYYIEKDGECLTKDQYAEALNLTKYEVTVGEFCTEEKDCIEGLRCADDLTCRCPSECSYRKDGQVCDCGEVEQENTAVVLVGVIFGLASMTFWIAMIHKVKAKYRKNCQVNTSRPMTTREYTSMRSTSPSSTAVQSPSRTANNSDTQQSSLPYNDPPPPYDALNILPESKNLPYPTNPSLNPLVPSGNLPYPVNDNLMNSENTNSTLPYGISPPQSEATAPPIPENATVPDTEYPPAYNSNPPPYNPVDPAIAAFDTVPSYGVDQGLLGTYGARPSAPPAAPVEPNEYREWHPLL